MSQSERKCIIVRVKNVNKSARIVLGAHSRSPFYFDKREIILGNTSKSQCENLQLEIEIKAGIIFLEMKKKNKKKEKVKHRKNERRKMNVLKIYFTKKWQMWECKNRLQLKVRYSESRRQVEKIKRKATAEEDEAPRA